MYLAKHRTPLPHISASLPSALKVRIRASAIAEFDNRRSPSAPRDTRLSQSVRANPAASVSLIFPSLLSITMKSLPKPCIFQNRILVTLPFVVASPNRQVALALEQA